AEDGIRDFHVTGVQTCALPIWSAIRMASCDLHVFRATFEQTRPLMLETVDHPCFRWCTILIQIRGTFWGFCPHAPGAILILPPRSEERRGGEECGRRAGGQERG